MEQIKNRRLCPNQLTKEWISGYEKNQSNKITPEMLMLLCGILASMRGGKQRQLIPLANSLVDWLR